MATQYVLKRVRYLDDTPLHIYSRDLHELDVLFDSEVQDARTVVLELCKADGFFEKPLRYYSAGGYKRYLTKKILKQMIQQEEARKRQAMRELETHRKANI